MHISGIDVVRDQEGTFRVLEDNVRVPSGVSYVLENRRAMAKGLPEAFGQQNVRQIALDHFLECGGFVADRLSRLVRRLRVDGFLGPPPKEGPWRAPARLTAPFAGDRPAGTVATTGAAPATKAHASSAEAIFAGNHR